MQGIIADNRHRQINTGHVTLERVYARHACMRMGIYERHGGICSGDDLVTWTGCLAGRRGRVCPPELLLYHLGALIRLLRV
jgi:hypothetical protein